MGWSGCYKRPVQSRAAISAVLVVLLSLVVVAPASAGARYVGKTNQGEEIRIQTNKSGEVTKVTIDVELDCNYTEIGATAKFGKFDRVTTSSFKSSFRDSVGNGARTGRVRARIRGERVDDSTFRGSFRGKGVYFKDGEKYATCRAVGVRWSASND